MGPEGSGGLPRRGRQGRGHSGHGSTDRRASDTAVADTGGEGIMNQAFAFGPAKKRGIVKRHKVIATILGFALAFSGGALAAWLISSVGSGYVKVGSLQAPTFAT